MDLTTVQQQLIHLLDGAHAHINFFKAIEDFPTDKINVRIQNVPYSPWEIVEHIRITQRDILDYISNPDYKELKFPLEYWPAREIKASPKKWFTSVKLIKQDLQDLKEIVLDPQNDLTAPLSHNIEHSIFREIIIIGNHNSYHTGQLLIFRRVLNIY